MGGLNISLQRVIGEALTDYFPDLDVEIECQKFPAKDPENIVNRCKNTGVQMEFSLAARNRFVTDAAWANRLSSVIRSAMSAWNP